jgi:hypothetical protein
VLTVSENGGIRQIGEMAELRFDVPEVTGVVNSSAGFVRKRILVLSKLVLFALVVETLLTKFMFPPMWELLFLVCLCLKGEGFVSLVMGRFD